MVSCENNLMCEVMNPKKLNNLKRWVNNIPNNVYLRLDVAKIIERTINSIKDKTKMSGITKFIFNNTISNTKDLRRKLNQIEIDTSKFQIGPGRYYPILKFDEDGEPLYSEIHTQAEYLSKPTNLYKILSLMDEMIGTIDNNSLIGNLINIKGIITNYYDFIACSGKRGKLKKCII